jgi:hypothetical protein
MKIANSFAEKSVEIAENLDYNSGPLVLTRLAKNLDDCHHRQSSCGGFFHLSKSPKTERENVEIQIVNIKMELSLISLPYPDLT